MATPAEIDPSLSKAQKTIDTLKSKIDKQQETIAELKKANGDLKSNGSRIKRIPKAGKGKGVKEVPVDGANAITATATPDTTQPAVPQVA